METQLEDDCIIRNPSSQNVQTSVGQVLGGPNKSAHEIGMVSLGANQDPRYIGPSSGYFLARVMLPKKQNEPRLVSNDDSMTTELVEALQGPLSLPPRNIANKICSAYFDTIHLEYPILHRPTFLKMLDAMYAGETESAVISFHVYMVLAIGASVLAMRTKSRLPGESYCLSALKYLHLLNIENSIQGLQCLLLLQIFAIHSPSVRFNVWYLNYQCLAAVLDLGIQRDITVESGISLLDQEMRTRIFWVVLMLDRIIATMMGRPIGLRDEACDLRVSESPKCLAPSNHEKLPQGLSDSMLVSPTQHNFLHTEEMQYSVHLFRAAKINSEIKYVANSIVHEAPRYAYPPVADINQWQNNVLAQLDSWAEHVPGGNSTTSSSIYLQSVCHLRYHGLCMLLLRPSPAIPKPTANALIRCHKSAKESIRIIDELYRGNNLFHSWLNFHGLVLSTLTLLYCLKAEQSVARNMSVNHLMSDMSTALSILSATGEHWSGAKKCRDILDDLGRSTIQWLQELNVPRPREEPGTRISTRSSQRTQPYGQSTSQMTSDPNLEPDLPNELGMSLSGSYSDFLSGQPFEDYFGDSESVNVDIMIRDLFQDFIPTNSPFG